MASPQIVVDTDGNPVSMKELEDRVGKDTTDALIKEMKIGQRYFTPEQITAMKRSELLEHCIRLRTMNGLITSTRKHIQDFDDYHTAQLKTTLGKATVSASVDNTGSTTTVQGNLLEVMLATMQQSENARIDAERLRK